MPRHKKTVRKQARTVTRWPPVAVQKMRELRKQGYSVGAISDYFGGVSKSVIDRHTRNVRVNPEFAEGEPDSWTDQGPEREAQASSNSNSSSSQHVEPESARTHQNDVTISIPFNAYVKPRTMLNLQGAAQSAGFPDIDSFVAEAILRGQEERRRRDAENFEAEAEERAAQRVQRARQEPEINELNAISILRREWLRGAQIKAMMDSTEGRPMPEWMATGETPWDHQTRLARQRVEARQEAEQQQRRSTQRERMRLILGIILSMVERNKTSEADIDQNMELLSRNLGLVTDHEFFRNVIHQLENASKFHLTILSSRLMDGIPLQSIPCDCRNCKSTSIVPNTSSR